MVMFAGGPSGGSPGTLTGATMGGGGVSASSIMSLIGSTMTAAGQYQELQDAQRIAEFNAQIALRNAKLRKQAAQLSLTQGKKQKASILARQRVMFAKAGVTMEGTPFDALVESAANLELDLQIDFFNAQVGAEKERLQSKVDTAQADAFGRQKITKPLTTLLSSRALQGLVADRSVKIKD